jgi:hypothetical protein
MQHFLLTPYTFNLNRGTNRTQWRLPGVHDEVEPALQQIIYIGITDRHGTLAGTAQQFDNGSVGTRKTTVQFYIENIAVLHARHL